MKTFIKCALLFLFSLYFQPLLARQHKKAGIDSLMGLLSKAKADTNKVSLLQKLTIAHDGIDKAKAMSFARQAYTLSAQLRYKKGIYFGLRFIGGIYLDMGENDKALKYYQKIYRISQREQEINESVMSLNNIGAVYERTSKYTLAADYFFKALKLAEQTKNEASIAKCESNIAVLFIHQGDYSKAVSYAKIAEKRYSRLKEPSYRAKNLEGLGNSYSFNNKLAEAIPPYLLALKLYGQIGDELGMAIIYTQMVNCYPNDPVKQIEYLQKARLMWDRIAPNNLNAIANIGNIGDTYFRVLQNPAQLKMVTEHFHFNKEKMLTDAESFLKQSMALSQKAKVPELLSQLTTVLSDLYAYKKDYKSALENLRVHVKLQDSLSSQEIKNRISKIEGEREIALRDKEIQTARLKMKQIWIYVIITLFVIILASVYFINRSNIGHLRLKNELQALEADERAKELLYRNKISESELTAIRSQMNPHFIFNVLNSIESYILENDPEQASRLVQKFATLSRLVLENSTQSLVSADREWKAINLYTELEAMRFGNSFLYHFHIDSNIDLSKLLLPPMLVQPLIENAIHHGIRKIPSKDSTVSIFFEEKETEIRITVEDNGVGIDESKKSGNLSSIKRKSIGLSAIRERIEILNAMNSGYRASFDIYPRNVLQGCGTVATLRLPRLANNQADQP